MPLRNLQNGLGALGGAPLGFVLFVYRYRTRSGFVDEKTTADQKD